jgi:purine-binding chemotaxis protein CheW
MNERPGRKALFVGVSSKDGDRGDQQADSLEEDLAVMISWVETALAGNAPDAAEDAVRNPALHPLASRMIRLIARAAEDSSARREQGLLFMEHPLPMALRDNNLSPVSVNQAYKSLFSDAVISAGSPNGLQAGESAESVFVTGKPQMSEIVMELPDGTKKHFQQYATPCRYSGKNVALALFSYLDITSLHSPHTQQGDPVDTGTNILSSGQYKNNPLPMLVLDSEFQILEANQAFVDETGLSREDLDGKHIDDLPFIPEEENRHDPTIQSGSTSPRRMYLDHPGFQRGYDLTAFSIGEKESPAEYIVMLYDVSRYLDAISNLRRELEGVSPSQSVSERNSGQERKNEYNPENPVTTAVGMPSHGMGEQSRPPDSREGARVPASASLSRGENRLEREPVPQPAIPEGSPDEVNRTEELSGKLADVPALRHDSDLSPGRETLDPVDITDKGPDREISGGDGKSYGIVEFELSGNHYALDITITREIVEMMPITSLPHAPPYLKGVMNLRGEIFNIIDVQKILGLGEWKSDSRKIIVLTSAATGGENIGIIVDDVQSVRQIHENAVEHINDSRDIQKSGVMKGIIKVAADDESGKKGEKHLVIWLDVQALVLDLIRQNLQKKSIV